MTTETESGVWIGPDFSIKEAELIPATSEVFVPIDVSPVRDIISDGIIFDSSTTILSTRSRYAQLGGEFPTYSHGQVSSALSNSHIVDAVEIPFVNHSQVPILLEAGPVCKLLHKQGPPLSGVTLNNLINDGQITVSGEEGKDWWLAKDPSGEPFGVGLFLDNIEKWLHPSQKPIRPKGNTTEDFREEMAKHLRTILAGEDVPIRVGQSRKPLFSTANQIGLIEPVINSSFTQNVRIANPQHINAPALYGGYPAKPWVIRTEVISTNAELRSYGEGLPPKGIIVTFYNVRNPHQN